MDIVERLRTVVSIGTGVVTPLRCEAADEIERLREALQEIACDCDHRCNENGLDKLFGMGCDNWIARSALQQKDNE